VSAAEIAAALALAAEGKAVFFCGDDKRPTCQHGFRDATSDPTAVRDLYRLYPGPLVGVAAGEASGFDVLDLDKKHDVATAWWTANRERLPTTRVHRTRSGGLHLLFRHADLVRNSVSKIARGIDTRGDGGYVIWWPASGLPVLNNPPLATWPRWLVDALILKRELRAAHAVLPVAAIDNRKLAALVRFVAGAAEGERNERLFWAACRVGDAMRSYNIHDGFAVAVLEEAAAHCGLPVTEARRTIRSAIGPAL
jgi:hypothetical protein